MKEEKVNLDRPIGLSECKALLKVPISERRRILAEQADNILAHYEKDVEVWESGGSDFFEY